MIWDTDISKAPKGRTVTRYVTHDKGRTAYDSFEQDHIIAASSCGKVTRSYWIPKEGRWCMFTKENPPIAWMPWPEHPSATNQTEDAA